MLYSLAEKLRNAKNVLLTTHRHCDGDGLGAQLAVFHALRKLGLPCRAVNVDRPPVKYGFLGTDQWIEIFGETTSDIGTPDLALIFDTNDGRLVEPLFSELRQKCPQVLFIDHHPRLAQGPEPTDGSIIDISAASTGELCFRLLHEMSIPMDQQIARALYTSVVFDTQLFRYVKSDPRSHLMAAELLRYERNPEEVHRHLFSTYTVTKMAFLAQALNRVEYFAQDRAAFISLKAQEFQAAGLARDDSGDIIDLIMNIGSIELAALLREDAPGRYKLSLRSKGKIQVLPLAEDFGGGGHKYASGAHLQGDLGILRSQLMKEIDELLRIHKSINSQRNST